MRTKTILSLSALVLCAAATPATAAELGGGWNVNGGAALVTDYRFRGISQTDKRFAIQGSISVSHESGFYVSTWGSSIDDYVAAGSDQEIDFIAGYRTTTEGGLTIDGGLLYYYYPGSGGGNSDFFEPYVSIAQTFGPATAKITANYAPKSSALTIGNGKEDNLYLGGDLSAAIPDSGVTVSAHFGHSFGPSYLTIGDEYSDWNIGVAYTTGPLTFGVQYVDTDGDFITPSGRNASKAGLVGTIGVAF